MNLNPISEAMTVAMNANSERNATKPRPAGCFNSFEELCAFVNANQQPINPAFHLPDYYRDVRNLSEHAKRLATLRLPETVTTVYEVCVPMNRSHSHVSPVLIAPNPVLTKDPGDFGITPELDRERHLKRPVQYEQWVSYGARLEWRQSFQHITQVGLVPGQHASQWFVFGREADADAYCEWAKQYADGPSPLDRAIDRALERLSDSMMDDYIDHWDD